MTARVHPTRDAAAAASALLSVMPGVITSIFRPTGSHQFGAIDIAPRYSEGVGLYHMGVKGCQVPVYRDMLFKLGSRLAPGVQIYLESDHFHVHDLKILPPHLKATLPHGRTFIESLPGCKPGCASCTFRANEREFERIY